MGLRTIKLALGPAVALGILLGAEPARATFPGKNGRLAYDENDHHIHLSGTQLVPHGLLEYDWSPTVSPDGTQVAFIRQSVPISGYHYRVLVVDIDGGVPLEIASSSSFGGPTAFEHIRGTAWTADGQRVSFLVGGDAAQPGVWTVGNTGSGLTRTVAGPVGGLSWSPVTDELVYTCSFRTDEDNLPVDDLCIFHESTAITRQLRIDYPNRDRGLAHPKWTANGETIVFTMGHTTVEGSTRVGRWDVFSIRPAGGGLAKLSDSGPAVCPRPTGVPGDLFADATYVYATASPSPSGDMTAVHGWKVVPWLPDCTPFNGNPNFYTRTVDTGIYRLTPNGKFGTLLQAGGSPNGGFDWEPILVPLKVDIDDGHGHPLEALKVELKRNGSTYFPINEGGSYTFSTLAPGDYVLRVTLIDYDDDGLPAAFGIHHDIDGTDPVWIERDVTVPLGATVEIDLSYADSPAITGSNLDPAFWDRLDDMAAIYYTLRPFVEWAQATLTPDTGPTVNVTAFATVFPSGTNPPVPPRSAYYLGFSSQVLLGTATSSYEFRDGENDECPDNCEWHEFTHHLYRVHVSSESCAGLSHHGFRNEDTCDSMSEGFAEFLPVVASQDLSLAPDANYAGFWDLEAHTKSWKGQVGPSQIIWREDLAVAALLWDLVDEGVDFHTSEVVGADGLHRLVSYTDTEQFTLAEIWTLFTETPPQTRPINVRRLWAVLGNPEITVDLDADLIPDVAPLDEVFLMHGFFPFDADQAIVPGHLGYHYDVAAAQRERPGVPRNDDVGYSDHRVFNVGGVPLDEFLPRENTPTIPEANLAFDVIDASGTPLAGATVELTVQSPGLPEPQVIVAKLDTGSAALVPLELLPHYDYALPVDGELPPCDPLTDVQVGVTVRTILNGYVSADTAAFDNCAYLQAVAAATGPAALELTASFPEDSTAPTSTILTSPTGPLAPGGATLGAWRVRVDCADPEVGGFASGCWRTEYRVNGGPLVPYVRSFEIGEPGSHVVEIRSLDGAGNAESFHSVTLDVQEPVDTDGDGLLDTVEIALGTSFNDADTDDDGLEDGDEVTRGTDPLAADSDLDGLNDGAEIQLGTNPLDDDTDNDGLRDGEELVPGLNPLDPDVDDDRVLDGPDKCRTVYNPAQRDTDGDGLGEVCDNCPFVQNFNQQDSDGDGAGNVCDCAPSDPARRAPASPALLAGKTDGATIVLSWPAVAGANSYSVTRGTRADLVAGSFGTCVGHSGAATFSDAEVPAPGALFTYLVQGQSFTCGSGSLGFGVNETLRVNLDPEACGPAVFVERLTVSETHVSGIWIAGTHLDTHTANGGGQSIGEEQSSGGPSTRFGFMEHRWVFDVAPGEVIELLVQGERSDPSDGDDVRFEWSTNGTTFTPIPMASLPFIPDGTVVSGPLPATLSGPVTIRVVDTVRTPGTDAFDWVWIDRMVVRSITF